MNYDTLKKFVDAHYSINEIARETGESYDKVLYWLQKYDLHTDPSRRNDKYIAIIEELAAKGYSSRKIAKEIGKSQSFVARRLKKQGIKTDPWAREKLYCLYCENELKKKTQKKYCSVDCQADYEFEASFVDGHPPSTANRRPMKRWLIRQRGHQCEVCKNTEWMEQPIPLELHHIDGNHKNNHLDNLQLICPNCHALTDTYKARNTGSGRHYRRERYKNGKSY